MSEMPGRAAESMEVEELDQDYQGIVFIGDPHVASYPPGHRRDDYQRSILNKLQFCMDFAREHRCLPIILGDLFHVPRNNPNHLLVDLMEIFAPWPPWVLVGNHDKHEARLTRDVSLWVLHTARVIRLLNDEQKAASVRVRQQKVLVGAAPDWTPLPSDVHRLGHDWVIWVTHHDLAFPGYEEARYRLREIPGIDLVVNGHIHTPKAPVKTGGTLWVNPGSLARITRSRFTREMKPKLFHWQPPFDDPCFIEVEHLPFEEVFCPLEEGEQGGGAPMDESLFIRGLENLALKRTTEGVGLKAFLEDNLRQDDPLDRVIWELYEEVMSDGEDG